MDFLPTSTQTEPRPARRQPTWPGVLVAAFLLMAAPSLVSAAADVAPSPAPDSPAETEAQAKEYRQRLEEGILSNSLGRHREAAEAFRAGLALCEAQRGKDAPDCSDPSMRLALELSNQERFDEADLQFARAEDLARKARSPLALPKLLTYRAMDQANRKDFEAALKLAVEANQKRQALLKVAFRAARSGQADAKKQLDDTLADLTHGLYVQASVAFLLGKIQEAKVTAFLVRKLIAKSESIPDWWIAFADTLLAEIELREGNVEGAEKRLRLALKAKQVALGNTRAVALSYMSLGAIYHEARRNPETLTASRPGLSILMGELREASGVGVERLEPFLQASFQVAQREPERRPALYGEMFVAAQLSGSSQTANSIAQMAARFASDRPEVAKLVRALQHETQLRDGLRITLGRAAAESEGSIDPKRISALKESYKKAAVTVAQMEAELKAVFPSYSDLVNPAPETAESISSLLAQDEALVYFVSGEKGGFVFVVRTDGVTAAATEMAPDDLARAIRALRAPFEKPGPRIAPYDLKLAHDVYRKLLGPVEPALRDVRHMVVVSEGRLLSLPFSLLVTTPPGDGEDRYRNAAWLVRDRAVSQMPSVSTFASFRRTVRLSTAPKPFVGFGNPAFEGKAGGGGMSKLSEHCQLGGAIPPDLIRSLAALPETADELRRVAKALGATPGSVHLGADVTEARVRGVTLDQYRVVYFATHGLLPGELRCQSQPALALSPPPGIDQNRADDGLLEASEIATLRLDADLVVLSACNTGGGGSGKLGGESLSGLARAFFQAGTRSVLVSHWQVDSVATAGLMTNVFAHLAAADPSARRRDIAEALRRAQLDLLSVAKTAHPYFWAAFTLVGEGRLTDVPRGARSPKQVSRSTE